MSRKVFLAIAAVSFLSVAATVATPAQAGNGHEKNWHKHAHKSAYGDDRSHGHGGPVFVPPGHLYGYAPAGYYYAPPPVVYAPPPMITVILPLNW
jgi:hypothetical protein